MRAGYLRFVAPVVLGAAIGFAAGWCSSESPGKTTTRLEAGPRALTGRASLDSQPQGSNTAAGLLRRTPTASALPTPASPTTTAAARAFLEAAYRALAPQGGAITGVLRTEGGAPVAGARITASTYLISRMRVGHLLSLPDDPLAARVILLLSRGARSEALTREAVTDANGAFAIDGLLATTYAISGEAPGAVVGRASRLAGCGPPARGSSDEGPWESNVSAAPGMHLELTAFTTGRAQLDLRLPDGTAPDDALLTLRPSGGPTSPETGRRVQWTPSSAAFDLPPGTWTILAERHHVPKEIDGVAVVSPPAIELASEPVTVTVSAGQTLRRDVALVARSGVRVRLEMPEGEPPTTQVELVCLPIEPGEAPTVEEVEARARESWSYARGRCAVGARRTGEVVSALAVVEDVHALCDVTLRLPSVRAAPSVRLKLFAPDGSPFKEYVEVREERQLAQEGGTIVLRAGAARTITLRSWTLGLLAVAIPEGEGDVEARFRSPAIVRLRVAPHSEFSVRGPSDEAYQMSASEATLAEKGGELELPPRQPGHCRLSLLAWGRPEGGGGMYAQATKDVDLVPGENLVALDTPPLSTVAFVTGEAGTLVWVRMETDPEEAVREVAVDDSGRALLDRVGPGRYVARFQPLAAPGELNLPAERRREVSVPGVTEVRLDAP